MDARDGQKKSLSLAERLWVSEGAKSDWAYFARWHYRSHHLGIVRFVTLLWHQAEPIGICVFQSPPVSLRQRNRYFGRKGKWTRLGIRALGKRLVMLSRVVLHPTWRGAGIAAAFVRRSCELCPWPWIEALAEMGHVNPFFEKAGFVRVGASASGDKSREGHSMLYGGRKRPNGTKGLVTRETNAKSRWGRPVYYVFDNRGTAGKGSRGVR